MSSGKDERFLPHFGHTLATCLVCVTSVEGLLVSPQTSREKPNTAPNSPDVTMKPTGASVATSKNSATTDSMNVTRPTPDRKIGKRIASQRGRIMMNGKMKK